MFAGILSTASPDLWLGGDEGRAGRRGTQRPVAANESGGARDLLPETVGEGERDQHRDTCPERGAGHRALLEGVTCEAEPGEFEIVVVTNDCSDRTANIAAGFPGVTVVDSPVASKPAALTLGDATATHFPRMYLDADIEVDAAAIRAVGAALDSGDVDLAAPKLHLEVAAGSWVVRAFYDVWTRAPVRAERPLRRLLRAHRSGTLTLRRLPRHDGGGLLRSFAGPRFEAGSPARPHLRRSPAAHAAPACCVSRPASRPPTGVIGPCSPRRPPTSTPVTSMSCCG